MDHRDRLISRSPSRRELLALGAGAFVVAVLPFGKRRRALVRRTVPLMGTLAEVAVVHRDGGYAHRAIDAAIDELRWVDRTLTRFRDDSDIGRANRLAAHDGVLVTPATAEVLRAALGWAHASDGAFDPCLGKAVRLWDVGRRDIPPPTAGVERLAGRSLYRQLDVGTRSGKPAVRFGDPDVEIDLGAIGKGYGVDRAVRALRDWGITDGLVNVGGDLYALGTSEDGDAWSVGVRSPRDPSRLAGRIDLRDAAVATSGDYLQYFEHGGRRYHHLLDARTGAPRDAEVHSVTVEAADCLTADAAATTVFGMGRAAGSQVLRRRAPDARIVSTI